VEDGGRGRKMKMSHNNSRNSSLVSIREAPLQKYDTDTHKDENAQTPILNLDTLKVIGRLVQAFKARIESESRIVK